MLSASHFFGMDAAKECFAATHQASVAKNIYDNNNENSEITMPKYVIERNIPNAGRMSPKELNGVSAKSCRVLHSLGPQIQWMQSYVTDDKLFCIYVAPDADLIREHALRGGFPADAIREVKTIIDPTTAE